MKDLLTFVRETLVAWNMLERAKACDKCQTLPRHHSFITITDDLVEHVAAALLARDRENEDEFLRSTLNPILGECRRGLTDGSTDMLQHLGESLSRVQSMCRSMIDRCPFHSRATGYRCEDRKGHEGVCHNAGDGFAGGWDPTKGPPFPAGRESDVTG